MKQLQVILSLVFAILFILPGALEASEYKSPEHVAVALTTGEKVEVDLSGVDDPYAYIRKLATTYAGVSPYKASIYYEYHPSQPQVYRFYLKGNPGTSAGKQASLEKAKELAPSLIGANDRETVTNIHHYIVSHVEYDYAAYEATVSGQKIEDFRPWSPEGALLYGLAVCEGYSGAMMILLDEVGIPNAKVIGYAGQEQHAWNMVYLREEGQWLHVDTTRNDTQGQSVSTNLPYLLIDSDSLSQHGYTWDQASTQALADARQQAA